MGIPPLTVALFISLFIAGVIAVIYIVRHRAGREILETILVISRERADNALIRKRCARRLSQEERAGVFCAWQSIRTHFQSDPKAAIVYADVLVSDLLGLSRRSNAHPAERSIRVAIEDRYRAAHAIAKSGDARFVSFAEFQRAMDLYSSLLAEILPGSDAELIAERNHAQIRVASHLQEHMP